MKRWIVGTTLLFLLSCNRSPADKIATPSAPTPVELVKGETLFNRNCSRCHGSRGTGSSFGPPFLSKIYEPSHHGDEAFHLAARNGVQSHHWNLGNMPPYAHLSDAEVDEIVRYVRWLQKEAGIF